MPDIQNMAVEKAATRFWKSLLIADSSPASSAHTVKKANIMSMYSIGMLLGVASSGFLSKKLGSNRCVRLLCLISFAAALIALRFNSVPVWNIAMFVIGYVEGPYVTYIALMGLAEFPEYSATVTSFTSLFTGLGSIIVTPIMGRIAQANGYGKTMYIATMILLIVYLVQAFVYQKKR